MIKQILDLLQISEFEGEHIDIAKGKYQMQVNIVTGKQIGRAHV